MATKRTTKKKATKRPARKNVGAPTMFGTAAVARAKKVVPLARVKEKETGKLGTVTGLSKGWLRVKWDSNNKTALVKPSVVRVVNGGGKKNPAADMIASALIGETVHKAFKKNGRQKPVQRKGAKPQRPKVNAVKRSVSPVVAGGKAAKKKRVVVRAKVIKKLVINSSARFAAASTRSLEYRLKSLELDIAIPTGIPTAELRQMKRDVAAIKAELLQRKTAKKKNPAPRANSRAAEKFASFHGRPATKTASADVSARAKSAGTMYPIGKLISVKIKGVGEVKGAPGSLLLADTKDRLWISGKIGKAKPGAKAGALEVVGAIEHVVYCAKKDHIAAGWQHYIHKLGEDTGAKPTLYIDPQGFGVIKGGEYSISDRGIIN